MRKILMTTDIIRKLFLLGSLLVILMGIVGAPVAGLAQDATPTQPAPVEVTPQPGAPVEVGGKTIFYVHQRIGSLLPADRAALISKRLNALATNPLAPPLEITLVETSEGTDVMNGEDILLTVTDNDAAANRLTRQAAAEEAAARIQTAIETTRQEYTPRARVIRVGETALLLLVLAILFVIINRLYKRLVTRLEQDAQSKKGVFSRRELVQQESILRILKTLFNLLRWVILILVLVLVVPFGLKIFPATAKIAQQLLQLVLVPFTAFWDWLIENESNFTTIGIIIVITYLLIRLVRFFFREIERGAIRIGGFEQEWAHFTSRIVSFLLIIGAVIVAFPYLPGSDSEAFKGITIFLGALFTLSSTSAVSNVVAGVIQTYTGAFRVGDVIKIGLTTGIVTEKSLLTTRVRTFKNEEVSIPNSVVLNTDVTNYTAMAKGKGLILNTTITIGYDAPWKQVHELLIAAGLDTPDIERSPAPFVLQTSLNDFNVSYQLNCYTKHPERMARVYSTLHANIQNQFNQAGVEIMSPTYAALRDGNTVTIPAEERPEGYQAPGFRLESLDQ
jgi:small-conductance mechanosensitive channel